MEDMAPSGNLLGDLGLFQIQSVWENFSMKNALLELST